MPKTLHGVTSTAFALGFSSLLVTVACSSNDHGGVFGTVGGAMGTESGGSANVGGNTTFTTGGTVSTKTGGNVSLGGNLALGGTTGLGGAASVGGKGSGGASTGGNVATGGANTGGAKATGGANTGGAKATGGVTAAGGNVSTGGTATGGAKATGGALASGGAASGGAASGGARATGGSPSTGGVAATGGVGVGGTTHTGVWKVMPLGDSITGSTCYPQLTSQILKNGGHTNFQFIGTNLNNQSCSGAPALQTEGHGGYFVTYLTTNSPPATGKGTLAELKTWAAEKPDIVLMHFGTNDCWSSIAPTNILSAYLTVLREFRAQNPAVILFVSKIIPLAPSGCSNCPTNVSNLDAAITAAWATTNSTATSPVYIIDHWTSFNAASDTSDGAHPNITGAQKMATLTYNALVAKNYF